jgi:dihydroorotate dehydrogenase (fumarate)
MNLETTYLGLKLGNPLIVGASPFSDNIHVACQLQDAGASAIVMRSLFEEQIDAEERALINSVELGADSSSEASSYFPTFSEYQLSPARYLRQIGHLRSALTIPVIASLNGCRPAGWTDYASRMESAGASAIELNLYQLVTDPALNASDVEAEMIETVGLVTSAVRIPVSVKLSPFHTSPTNFALSLENVGVAGVVLFNRFYQPDFDLDELEVKPELKLSDPSELLMRLRWLAILSPHVRGSLAATGGVHSSDDVVKAILAGAHAVQLVSVLLRHGPRLLSTLQSSLRTWMKDHGYASIDELRGALNLRRCPDSAAFERANYQRILQSWRV